MLSITRADKNYNLTIFRVGVFPSRDEWRTVLTHWPYPAFSPLPAEKQDGKYNLLIGTIRLNPQQQLPL